MSDRIESFKKMYIVNYMKYKYFSLVLITLGILLISPYSFSSDREEDRQSETQTDGKEFVVVYSPKKLILDPLHIYTTMETELCTALYEGLLTYHPFTLEPISGVAEDWDVNENKTVYRFYLRDEALYSNGDPVMAKDFKDSWLRILEPEANAEYSFLFDVILGAQAYRLGEQGSDNIGIRVISDKILEVELEKPASHFLKLLCHLSFAPIHPHYLDKENWGEEPSIVGNGPFYIVKRSDRELILSRNRLYWDTKNVKLDKIRVRFIEDAAEITEAFNQGKIHWANNWETSLLIDRTKIVFNPLFATSYFFFVCEHPPWNDERVRRALALMLPWEEIRSESIIFATSRLIPPIPGYPEIEGLSKTNLDEALSLLQEAGYPQGRELPPIIIKVPKDSESERIAGVMAETWEKNIKRLMEKLSGSGIT